MKNALLLISFLFYNISNAQVNIGDSTCHANVEKQAILMANLLVAKDYKEFSKYTYSPILKMMGGADKMAAYMEKSFKKMEEEEGFSINKVTIDNSSKVIRIKNQIQCTLTQIIEMKHIDGKLIQKSTLVGISNDQGKNWGFIDTHGKNLKELQETLKELSNDLVIPKPEQPTVIPN
jgi:hypothetical protein